MFGILDEFITGKNNSGVCDKCGYRGSSLNEVNNESYLCPYCSEQIGHLLENKQYDQEAVTAKTVNDILEKHKENLQNEWKSTRRA